MDPTPHLMPQTSAREDDPPRDVTAAWLAHRRRVLDVCYRMLGTLADAEDALQETFIRLARHGTDDLDDVEAWLVTVSGRVCLDRLRADRSRSRYVGPWLPSPIIDPQDQEMDPADRVTLDDTIRIALMSVLEQLSPAERAAFVLHDVFGLTFEQVAETVGRTPAACRKLASRARATIRADNEPRFDVDASEARAIADRFARACSSGDIDGLVALLDPDAVGEFDSGGRVPGAPLEELVGAEVLAATLVLAFAGSNASFSTVDVNDQPGVQVQLHERTMAVISLETDGERVVAIRAIGNPDKLAHLDASGRRT